MDFVLLLSTSVGYQRLFALRMYLDTPVTTGIFSISDTQYDQTVDNHNEYFKCRRQGRSSKTNVQENIITSIISCIIFCGSDDMTFWGKNCGEKIVNDYTSLESTLETMF